MVGEKMLKVIHFSDLGQWNAKSFFSTTITSQFPISSIGKNTIHITKKTKLSNFPESEFKILGISSEIGMFDAYTTKGKNINQPYIFVEDGCLAYNPYRVNIGSIGLKTKLQKNEYISPAYVVLKCKENIDPEYLFILLKSSVFNRLIRENTTGSVRQTLSYDNLSKIRIPVPTIELQKKIVQDYMNIIKRANEAKKEAEILEDSIDNFLFTILDIIIPEETVNRDNSLLKTTNFKELYSWGIEFNCNAINPQEIFKSNTFSNKPIRYYCELNPSTRYPDNIDTISFIPMESISDIYGEISERRQGKVSNCKGYTKFKENDILWAKITPCMQNGKSAIARALENGYGYGSTEFHVIRVNENTLPEYIYCFLRTKVLRNVATAYFTGSSGQQRVGKKFLEMLTIPNIPISSCEENDITQEKIVEHIFSIKQEIKKLHEQYNGLLKQANDAFETIVFK